MKIFSTLTDINESIPCALALGTFDGLHRGHMAVISAACGTEYEPAVLTFNASPSGGAAVVTEQDKLEILEKSGIARVYSFNFDELRDMPAEEFVSEVLFKRCRAVRLFCGEDFRFGRGARGDVALLKKMCDDFGARLSVISPVEDTDGKISSTRIRAAVEQGDILTANRLLGRPFGFSLTVIHGNHLGTGLGTPTINQALPKGFVLPKFGVYASWAEVDGKLYYGVTNIGVKPTVGSDSVLSETWMPEFSGDIYGKQVRLYLLEFIRAEKKFGSLDELRDEIKKNAVQAERIAKSQSMTIKL